MSHNVFKKIKCKEMKGKRKSDFKIAKMTVLPVLSLPSENEGHAHCCSAMSVSFSMTPIRF